MKKSRATRRRSKQPPAKSIPARVNQILSLLERAQKALDELGQMIQSGAVVPPESADKIAAMIVLVATSGDPIKDGPEEVPPVAS